MFSVGDAVGHISASSLRRADNLHDLAFVYAEVASDGVLTLDLGQLALSSAVSFKELSLFGVAKDHVFGHKLVTGDVHEELFPHEYFEVVWCVILERL